MVHQAYVDPIINDLAYIYQVAATTLAFFFNFTLLFIVHKTARKEIGRYRNLITFFALSDLYYNTVHIAVYPIPESYGNAFFVRGHGFYTELIGCSLYAGAYAHAFPILIFHFLYRLLVIKYPRHLQYFSYFMLSLVVATAACNTLFFSVFHWLFRPDEESMRLLAPVFNGSITIPVIHTLDTAHQHAQALYWTSGTFSGPRWGNLIGTAIIAFTMGSAYAAIIFCTFFINKYLKQHITSAHSIRIHKQLFRSLIYQSFVPLFTAYYPAAVVLLFPVFGEFSFRLGFVPISYIVPPACVTHPLIDPILLILTITEYRFVTIASALRALHF